METTYKDRVTEKTDGVTSALTRRFAVSWENWEYLAYTLLFIAAIFTRFFNLGARVMSHDESLHTYYSWRLETAGDYQHTPLMHGPILFHVTALMYFLFGDTDFTARLYPAILGVILVLIPILFRRWLGKVGSVLASVMFLISPLLLYYNRYIREDTACYVSAILMAYAILMYLDGPEHLRRRARWLFLLAGAMIWCLGSKESAFMYIAIFGSMFTLYWLVRVYQAVRGMPSRLVFQWLGVAILLGAVASLAMVMISNIALSNAGTLADRLTYLGQQVQGIFSGQAPGLEFTAFLSWSLIALGIFVVVTVGGALWATRHGGGLRPVEIVEFMLVALVVCLVLLGFEEYTLQPIRDAATDVASLPPRTYLPIIAEWIVSLAVIAALAVAKVRGWWIKLYRFPEFDVLIVMGTLILPWLTALFIKATGANPTDYSSEGIRLAVAAVIPLLALSTIAGLLWDWRRWLICALVFYIPFAFFFTTMFTNPTGLASGMIGSLGYWLEQQGVQRGSQPRYYYALVIMPVYEYLPVIGAFLAMLAGLTHFWRYRLHGEKRKHEPEDQALPDSDTVELNGEKRKHEPEDQAAPDPNIVTGNGAGAAALRPADDANWLKRPSFLLFVAWWGIFNFFAYTIAGEKMPWLGVHLTIPLILLTAWYFGRVFSNTDWAIFRRRGWLYLILLPLLGVALVQVAAPLVVGPSPFQGLQRNQLADFYKWLAVIAVALIAVYLIVRVILITGLMNFRRMVGVTAFVVLSLLTFRTAWMAAFINYDYANEYLVYAHGAPGIKLMMQQLEDISERTTDGMNIKFAWGGNAWPVTWYFRHLTNATFFADNPTPQAIGNAVAVYASADIQARVEPLLQDNYYRFDYIRMWWPDQEYFYLSAQRVDNALDLSASNTQAAQIRKGMFDIWWDRDYSAYGTAINKDYSLQNWPVSERFYLYIRKDVAAQVWNLGTGAGTVLNPLANQTTNVCTSNWQQKGADLAFSAAQGGAMQHPLDVAVDDTNKRVYIAEEFANRVSVYDENGTFLISIQGGAGDFTDGFNRPNGVAVAPNGNLYVADTWNYRILEFSPQGNLITKWGQQGQFGAQAQTTPTDAFWGPRDVAVDKEGNVYVADTGNKRVRVYTGDGQYLRDIGSGGNGLGQLDEPSGLAIDNGNNRLYVADTWNRRISVFQLDGKPLYTFDVHGWYEDQGNRPYLAIDQTRNLLYVTDPDAGRVLVYDLSGNCVGSFGQPSDTITDNTQFTTVGGMDTDTSGNLYVSDAAAGRALKFGPFVDAVQPDKAPSGSGQQPQAQATQEATEQAAG